MATSEGTLRARLDRRAPRWRAIAAASVLVGTLWSAGFAAGRLTASTESPTRAQAITAAQATARAMAHLQAMVAAGNYSGGVGIHGAPGASVKVYPRPAKRG